jgi:hypothetical protein
MPKRNLPLFQAAEAVAKGRKPRAYTPASIPPPKEWKLQAAIVKDIVRPYLRTDWKCFHVANGELRDKATAGKLRGMGVEPGIPDLGFLQWRTGIVHWMELKRSIHDDLSEFQEAFMLRCRQHGVPWACCCDLNMAWDQLAIWDALRIVRSDRGGIMWRPET